MLLAAAPAQLAGASLLLLANKQDIAGAQSMQALSEALGLAALARGGRHVHVASVSAATGAGLLPAFEWLVADVAARLFLLE